MNPKPIEQAQNPLLARTLPALLRARKRAEELAAATNTAIVDWVDGKIVRRHPGSTDRVAVSSQNVRSIGYDRVNLLLEIEVADDGTYLYFDVPSSVWEELRRAPSAVAFLNTVVKQSYRCARS